MKRTVTRHLLLLKSMLSASGQTTDSETKRRDPPAISSIKNEFRIPKSGLSTINPYLIEFPRGRRHLDRKPLGAMARSISCAVAAQSRS
jgi:hypothetical protein